MARCPRWYRVLLRLFPRPFREEYGPEMERLFSERWGGARRGGRRWALTVAAVVDVVTGAGAEWLSVWRREAGVLTREAVGMDGWIQDLRFGVRSLLRRPAFTATAMATLALGIGATVAIFSVVHGVLLRPLPYPDADRIVTLWETDIRDGSRGNGVDHPDIRTWQAQVDGFAVAGYSGSRPTLTGMGEPEALYTARVTNGLLDVFGLQPALGRDLAASDDVPGGPNVAVVSHDFWLSRLGGDPDVLGRILVLNGTSWEVVGVAPEGFDFPNGSLLWRPMQHDEADCGHGCRVMNAVGRIEAGSTLEQVQQRMDAVSRSLAQEFPNAHRDSRTTFESILDTQVSDVRVALWVLMGAVAMVLLIACANVANLLLVRSADRVGEVALRATLGAPRGRLLRQLLTESFILAAGGGVAGLLLASWGVGAVVGMAPPGIPRLEEAGLNGPVLAFALVTVLVVTLLFGLTPALKLVRTPFQAALSGTRGSRGGRRGAVSRGLLLSGEVALSLMLLLGAGLLFGTLRQIRATDLGFRTEQVERFRLSLPGSRYDTPGVLRFYQELEARLTALPQVDVAGMAFGVPMASGNIRTSVSLLDREEVPKPDRPSLAVRPASPGYLEAMGIPLVRGRWFDRGDSQDNEGVVVINQAAAAALYPGVDPLGRRLELSISWGFDDDPVRTIVGVVGDTRSRRATRPDEPTAYLPNDQFGAELMYVTMRLARGGGSALPDARRILSSMDPALAITSQERMEDVVADQVAPTRFYMALLGVFSALALVLAAVGLYGVVAYAVSRRTREIGIRVALGAHHDRVVGMIIREGLGPAVIGVVVGVAGSLAGGRAMGALLYGVKPTDPVTMASVTAILLLVVVVATFVPARKATRIPPATALRNE